MNPNNAVGPLHDHVFDDSNPVAERSTRIVMWIKLPSA